MADLTGDWPDLHSSVSREISAFGDEQLSGRHIEHGFQNTFPTAVLSFSPSPEAVLPVTVSELSDHDTASTTAHGVGGSVYLS